MESTIEPFTAVHRRVAARAALDPQATAITEADGRTISYRELTTAAQRLAGRLRAIGVGPEDRVAVWLDRSIGLVTAMLGILEAGAAYSPVDPRSPPRRIRELIAMLDAAALVTDRDEAVDRASGLQLLPPSCEPESDILELPTPVSHPAHLAYVVHTSGSSGKPKGVAMSHRGLARLVDWQVDNSTPGLRTLMFAPVAFDVSFQEVFSTLCTGGVLVMVEDRIRRDPERLLVALDELAIERLFLPYVALQQLALASKRLGRVPRSLVQVITAGERLILTEAIAGLFRAMPAARLYNHYGPTETHLATAWTLDLDPDSWPELPPIGVPVAGTLVHVLDDNLQLVRSQEPGELYIGGIGLARVYLGDSRRTAERFLPDPYSEIPGSVMYRTGDMVRPGEDGVLQFVGRRDDQLKVRGFRVEPAEVELALCKHPQILEAAVVLRNIAEGIDALVAYLVTGSDEIDHQALTEHLAERLPDYMIPSRFLCIDALPLNSNGKVDRRGLIARDMPATPAPPSPDSLLELVRSVWTRVLGHDDFDLDEDFFDVGGDSMLATWVVTELGLALGREVSLSMFLDAGTVEASAAALAELDISAATSDRRPELVTLRAGPANRVLVLVHPLGGELLAYRELAQSITASVRILGLRFQAKSAAEPRIVSLEAMAAQHLEQLVTVQPVGPYRLAGWSFGGVLAYEIAQQLRARGAEVAFLGLIDANPVLDPTTGIPTRDANLIGELDNLLADIDADDADADISVPKGSLARGLLGDIIPEGVKTGHLRKYLLSARAAIDAAGRYTPQPYQGTLDLFQAAASNAQLKADLAAELRRLTRGGLKIHEVPGDHHRILRGSAVVGTARAFDEALRRSANQEPRLG